jgi:hypothetical protein
MNLDVIVDEVLAKKREFSKLVEYSLHDARQQHPRIHSRHEGLAVIWEEFEELKQEIFKKEVDPHAIMSELSQISAMCQRVAEDCLLKCP